MLTLVGPSGQKRAHVFLFSNPASDRQRDEDNVGRACDDIEQSASPLVGGAYIEERDLVGPLRVVPPSLRHRVAGGAQPDEAHP